jgi:hypothetical protein
MGEPAAILLVLLFPVWSLTGVADWACHRATRIESTSGLHENLLHWVMFAEIGLIVGAMALLQVNAGLLALIAALFLVHEATVWIDLRFTVPRREVGVAEQMVHSFQEVFPLLSLALLAALAWDQALAMVGLGSEPADWRLRWKDEMLPPALLLGGAAMAAVCNVALLAQETWACLRARRGA